jgi:hypothetical protein
LRLGNFKVWGFYVIATLIVALPKPKEEKASKWKFPGKQICSRLQRVFDHIELLHSVILCQERAARGYIKYRKLVSIDWQGAVDFDLEYK